MHGGGLISHPFLRPTPAKTGAYTAAPFDLVVCDVNTTGSFTVTLPASSFNGARIGVLLSVQHSASPMTRVVTVASAGTIQSLGDHKLYLLGDYFELVWDAGRSEWVYVVRRVTAHKCRIYRGTAQSINADTFTKCLLGTTEYDYGGLADLTNSRIVFRRAGPYTMLGGWVLSISDVSLDAALRYQDTTVIRSVRYRNDSGGSVTGIAHVNPINYVTAAGETVFLYIEHSESAAQNTLTAASQRPYLEVTEIL